MRSFFDDKPQKVFYFDKSKDWTLLLLGVSFLIILLIVLFISKKINLSQKTNIRNLYHSDKSLNLVNDRFLYCPPHDCAISLSTGVKRCSADETPVLYDIVFEGCTQKNYCTNDKLPYAVNRDGSTGSKICDHDNCRCSKVEYCADMVSSIFDIEGGSPYDDTSTWSIGQKIVDSNFIEPNGREFCKINVGFLNKLNGNCDFSQNFNQPLNYENRRNNNTLNKYYDISPNCYNYFCKQFVKNIANPYNVIMCFNNLPCHNGYLSFNVDKNFGYYRKEVSKYWDDFSINTVSCRKGIACVAEINDGSNKDNCLLGVESDILSEIRVNNASIITYDNDGKEIIGNSYIEPPVVNRNGTINTNYKYGNSYNYLDSNNKFTYVPAPNCTKLSLYVSRWDDTLNKNICSRLVPLVFLFPIMGSFNNGRWNDGKNVIGIQVDACGRDFSHCKRIKNRSGYFYPNEKGDAGDITKPVLFVARVDNDLTNLYFEVGSGIPANNENTEGYGITNGRITCVIPSKTYSKSDFTQITFDEAPTIEIVDYYFEN